jgi:hypothetical protein
MTRDDAGRPFGLAVRPSPGQMPQDAVKAVPCKDRKALALRMHRISLDRIGQFQTDLLRSPAWDVLLSLFIAQSEDLDVPFASLCVANRLSHSMGKDAVRSLESVALARWKPANDGGENDDKSLQLVEITSRGVTQMDQFLQRVALSA